MSDDDRGTISGYDLKLLIDSQPVIVSVIDPDSYTVLYQNKTGQKKLGVIQNKTCHKNIPKLDTVCPFCKMSEARTTGTIQSSEVNLPDGTWLLVQFAPVLKSDGTTDIVETITDITEQKHHDEENQRTIALLVDREEEIGRLREQVKSLSKSK